MLKLKHAALATLAVAGTLATSSVFAAGLEIWNGSAWVRSGTVVISGPTTATYLGNTVPCTSAFTLTLTNGAAQVTNATFTGSGACTGITKVLPWTVSAPTAIADPAPPLPPNTSVNLTISGINIRFPTPPQTCTGSVTGELDNADPYSPNPPTTPGPYNLYFTFSGTLAGGCSVSHRAPGLTSNTPIRAYFP